MKGSRLIIHLIIIVLLLGQWSCSTPGNESGSADRPGVETDDSDIRKTYDNAGNLVSLVEYKDDKRDGTAYNYYKNGKPKLKVEYVDGKKHGTYTWYYESGQPYKEAGYSEGLRDGIERFYREDGSLKYETPYKADFPGTGFIEYAISGEPKKYLESLDLMVNITDRLNSGGDYSVYLGLTDYSLAKEVYYYFGKLTDGQYLNEDLEELYSAGMTAEKHLDRRPVDVSVAAEILTKDGKTIVLQKGL